MSSNLTDIHAIRVYDPVASKREHRLKRPFVIYEEPLEPTIFVQPENPTSVFTATNPALAAQEQAPFTGAPPFAPGGPLNPYPARSGMAPPSASTYGDLPTNIPGQPGFDPTQEVRYTVPEGPGLASVGGYGAFTPPATAVMQPPPNVNPPAKGRLPGKVPGKFQPGGGQPQMPNQPMQNPQQFQNPRMPQPGQLPVPQPPIQPPPPGGQAGAKPRGFRTLPMPERFHPPAEPPKPPGQWVTVDAGRGQPPAYGFLSQREEEESGVDTGLEGRPTPYGGRHSEQSGSTTKPSGEKSGEKGHYVPILLGQVQPDVEMEPAWVWIPEIDAEYGVRKRDRDDDRPKVNPLGK